MKLYHQWISTLKGLSQEARDIIKHHLWFIDITTLGVRRIKYLSSSVFSIAKTKYSEVWISANEIVSSMDFYPERVISISPGYSEAAPWVKS